MGDLQRAYYVLVDIKELKASAGDVIRLTEVEATKFASHQLQLFHVAHRNGLVGEDGTPNAVSKAPPPIVGLRDWDKKFAERKKVIFESSRKGVDKKKKR